MHSKAWLDARQQGDASFLASRSFRTFTAYSSLQYLHRNPLYSGNNLTLLFLPRLNPTYSLNFSIAVNYFSKRAFHFTGSMDKLRSDSS